MPTAIYLTHPEVEIDPEIAVPDWGSNAVGADRVAALVERFPEGDWLVYSSAERKALETAWPLSAKSGSALRILPLMHENDRSSTGFLPPEQFDAAADAFFANPDQSFSGWETAAAAQRRILREVSCAVETAAGRNLLICGHGGVGTLLFCALGHHEIDRKWDQNCGGHWFSFDTSMDAPDAPWAPMETLFA